MRYRTLENLGRSQKRQRKDEVENETAARVNVEEVVVTRWHICEKRTISCRNGKWKRSSD